MYRVRFLPAIFAISVVASAILARAQNDTPAQAAARAALEQQMNQMNNEQAPGSTNVTPPPAEPSAPPPTAKAPPAPAPTPQFSTNVPMTANMESTMAPAGMSNTNEPPASESKSQTNASTMSAPPTMIQVTNEAAQYPVNPPIAPLPPPQGETTTTPATPPPPTHPVPVPPSGTGNQWPTTGQSTPGAQQVVPPVVTGAGPSLAGERPGTNAVPVFGPITAPPLPISQEKQRELQSLLSQYMANQITPAQYQQQRAQIMAEPN